MSTLDFAMEEMQSQLGMSDTKAGSLLSGLLSFITQQSGGVGGFIDRFKSVGLGDQVSSWFSGFARNLSTEQVERVLGSSTISGLAAKAGVTVATASSAIALILPRLMQSLAPGGVVPSKLPSELTSYVSGSAATVATESRDTFRAVERTVARSGISRFLWPLLAVLGAFLLGVWIWMRGTAPAAEFDPAEQVRLAVAKASSALADLKPGFSALDLAGALNLDIINFSSGSAVIPADSADLLSKAAVAIRSVPEGSVLEIAGYTDNTGDSNSNLQLSQERAEAVRNHLIAYGVAPSALVAKGYGDTKPIASNETQEGKFRNRRIEFAVVR